MNHNLMFAISELLRDEKDADIERAAENISLRYRSNTGNNKNLILHESEALAYAAARMPATYGAVGSSLRHTLEAFCRTPKTLLDAGAGTGSAMWASDSLLDLRQITCIEREELMIKTGKKIGKYGSDTIQNANWIKENLVNCENLPTSDLVISSYMLNEMTWENVQKLIWKLSSAAMELLLIVEPGTTAGFKLIRKIREEFIKSGSNIIAPCTHCNECVLPPEDWCHFTNRIARSKLHKKLKNGEAPYEDEKFSYLAVSKFPALQHNHGRILRHPQIQKGLITMDICSEKGYSNITIRKKEQEKFRQARKASAGDTISF